jgi:hypothetical protein
MGHRRHCCNGMRGVYTDLFGSIDSPFVDSEGSFNGETCIIYHCASRLELRVIPTQSAGKDQNQCKPK